MLKKLAVTLALCLCASVFVVAGMSTPASSVNPDAEAAFCPFEVEVDGQVKIIKERCTKNVFGECANPGGSCGNKKGVCTNVPTNPLKKNSKLTCKCVG